MEFVVKTLPGVALRFLSGWGWLRPGDRRWSSEPLAERYPEIFERAPETPAQVPQPLAKAMTPFFVQFPAELAGAADVIEIPGPPKVPSGVRGYDVEGASGGEAPVVPEFSRRRRRQP